MTRYAGIPLYDAAGTATATLAKTGMTVLESVEAENVNTVIVYLQLFDAAAASGVTLGVTVPTVTRQIPAGGGASAPTSRLIDLPTRFGLGLVYAVTTTRNGSAAPATVVPLNLTLQ